VSHYAFPSVEALAAGATEAHPRDAAFGYRTRYIVGTTTALAAAEGAAWLTALRSEPWAAVADALRRSRVSAAKSAATSRSSPWTPATGCPSTA